MYEHVTYEALLERMLNCVLEKNPNLDTREGSVIYDALAPAAVELQNLYIQLDTVLNETFADTATREYLIKRAAERGIAIDEATYAIRKGEFNIDVPIGARFSLNTLNYVVTEKISDGVFRLQCETAGYVGNTESGNLLPIDYIDGLETAVLTDVLIPGEDEEDTEHFRERYFDSLNEQPFGGNIADYKSKVGAIDGVGGVKVYPTWNGGGTVKLVIIDSSYQEPSSTLIADVQEAVDPEDKQGNGTGIAPIGHIVTVVGCTDSVVNIQTSVTLQSGWDWAAVLPYVNEAIDSYFAELSSNWADLDNIIVRISQIEMRLLNLEGVLDVADTKLNGAAQNLVISADCIPVRGEVTNG